MEDFENYQITEDLRQSDEYANYLQTIGWQIIRLDNINVFIKKLGMFGICKIQRYKENIDFKKLEKILKEYQVMRVILEPELNSNVNGYKVNKEPLLGTKSLRINLKQGEEKLFNSFQKDCRYTLRKVLSIKYQVLRNNFDQFYEVWKKSGERLNIWIPNKKEFDDLVKCFGKDCFCLTINDKAGCLVLLVKDAAFYYYAGATKKGTKENLPYLVVWEAMKEAKKRGAKVWDFEGIYDERWPDKKWKGFSHFKKSFGGCEIEFPGSFARWRWPF